MIPDCRHYYRHCARARPQSWAYRFPSCSHPMCCMGHHWLRIETYFCCERRLRRSHDSFSIIHDRRRLLLRLLWDCCFGHLIGNKICSCCWDGSALSCLAGYYCYCRHSQLAGSVAVSLDCWAGVRRQRPATEDLCRSSVYGRRISDINFPDRLRSTPTRFAVVKRNATVTTTAAGDCIAFANFCSAHRPHL